LGKAKRRRAYSDFCEKKRPAYTCRTKEAVAVNESSLGSKEESGWQEDSPCTEKRHTYACRAKEALRADESALGSQKESWIEVTY